MVSREQLINVQKPIIDILEEIELHLQPKALTVKAEEMRYLLLGLNGAVRQYLKEKSKVKEADKNGNDKINEILGERFNNYKQNWVGAQAIEQSPEAFIDESKVLLTTIYKYLNQEKNIT